MQQQRAFGRLFERPAGLNIIGQGQSQRRLHWIHTSDQVVMLRSQLKRGNLLSADGKKYPEGFRSQCLRRFTRIGDLSPAICRRGPPRRTAQDNKRCASLAGRRHRMSRHSHGIRVRGINQRADLVVSQILRKPSDPADPPVRTGTGCAMGTAVRPASEIVTARSVRSESFCASSRASVVPPRIRTCLFMSLAEPTPGLPHRSDGCPSSVSAKMASRA